MVRRMDADVFCVVENRRIGEGKKYTVGEGREG